jgi:pimeloyl-ACP methyl ester carboxylesterase
MAEGLSGGSDLQVRKYGESGPLVIVLHGGPAAVGSAAPIARGLADGFRVLEPWQRGSGDEPLTVARHVADLHEVVASYGEDDRPALVGESWGAMLALAYAAEHPGTVRSLVLVGCGTFDTRARARMQAIIDERMNDAQRRQLACLADEGGDPGEKLNSKYDVIRAAFDYDPVSGSGDDMVGALDARAHTETWNDMVHLQAEGVYPAAFASITAPVLMLHGDYDPHPGEMTAARLGPHLRQLEYRELSRCGHSPWRERHARDAFFSVLRAWLGDH